MKTKLSNKDSKYIIFIILISIVLGIFTEFISTLCIMVILLFNKKVLPVLTYKTLIIIAIVFLWSVISITINNYELSKFFQQFILLGTVALSYSYILTILKNQYHILFGKYINIMFVISCLGLLQFIIFFIFHFDILFFSLEGIKPSYLEGQFIRVSSIMREPGYLGSSLSPVIAFIIFDKNYFFKNKLKSILIFITFLLTFASISYTILALILFTKFILRLRKNARIIILIIFGTIASIFSYFNSVKEYDGAVEDGFFSAIFVKLSETINADNAKHADFYEEMNASTYALLVNKWVATNAPSRMFGTGLGTHEQSYKKLYSNNAYELYGLNSEDGYSLYNRVFSEFGYVGLILLFIFLIKYLNTKNIINLSALFFIIAVIIRGGHYTMYGTVMFFYLYYLTSKIKKDGSINFSNYINSGE